MVHVGGDLAAATDARRCGHLYPRPSWSNTIASPIVGYYLFRVLPGFPFFVTITVTLRLARQARRVMDEHVEQAECVDQVIEELPDYALMVDVPD